MVFSSLLFLFRFLPPVLLLYFIVPKRFRNTILLLASLLFYGWGEPLYILVMLASILMNFFSGYFVSKYRLEGRERNAKAVLILSIVLNLLALGFFKYTDFLLNNWNTLFGGSLKTLGLALPIGISFYTFQSMSYPIDIYRGDASRQKNIITFGTYVALFPQLIAGPIVRYKTIENQLNERTITLSKMVSGIQRFTIGLCKKVLLANSIGILWDEISSSVAPASVLTAWLGALAFTFQIYFDFSGYSDMAIGLGKLFGFEFPENFRYPYVARSVTDFWRRWHISLSTWFREYLYIPLGGNRRGKLCQIRNLLIVWVLTGFWHGAGWNYLVWGLYFALLLIFEKLFLERFLNRLPRFFSTAYTLFAVVISWVIFARDTSLSSGFSYLSSMFTGALLDDSTLYYLSTYGVLFLILIVASTPLFSILSKRIEKKLCAHPVIQTIFTSTLTLGGLFLCVAYLVDGTYNPFLYFQF